MEDPPYSETRFQSCILCEASTSAALFHVENPHLCSLGAERMPRGARVRVRVTGTDLLTLDVHASVVSRLDDPDTTADDATAEETEADDVSAGPLTLAIDVREDGAPEEAAVASAPTA